MLHTLVSTYYLFICVSWAQRINRKKSTRSETLQPFCEQVIPLQYSSGVLTQHEVQTKLNRSVFWVGARLDPAGPAGSYRRNSTVAPPSLSVVGYSTGCAPPYSNYSCTISSTGTPVCLEMDCYTISRGSSPSGFSITPVLPVGLISLSYSHIICLYFR